MSEMVVRLTAALIAALQAQAEAAGPSTPYVDADDPTDAIVDGHIDLTAVAEAMLAEMLEPTDVMLAAIEDPLVNTPSSIAHDWRRMIDAEFATIAR
jgi:hypothetical protein